MNKKIAIVVSSITTVFLLGGCTPSKPMPTNHVVYQTGPSAKLGLGTAHHCIKCQHRHRHH